MQIRRIVYGFLTIISLLVASCVKDAPIPPSSYYSNGVFVTNEGPYQGNGSLSFYARGSGAIENNIFERWNNGAKLGSVVQSMFVSSDNKAYIVVNDASKIIIADANNMTFLDSIGSNKLTLPRYFLGVSTTKAYISQYGNSGNASVLVYDIPSKAVTKTIPIGKGADRMLLLGSSLYVANDGGFGIDSTISIINTTTDVVTKKLRVGINSNSMAADVNGDLWVLCGGNYALPSQKGTLVKVSNGVVVSSDSIPKSAQSLVIAADKKTIYFIADGKIYSKDATSAAAATLYSGSPIGLTNPYSLGIDPSTGYLFIGDAKDYANKGALFIVDPVTKALKNTVITGIIPGNFWFF
jgi:DNA-binding beta-propeller fold protein YncE